MKDEITLQKKTQELDTLMASEQHILHELSNLTKEQATNMLLAKLEVQLEKEVALLIEKNMAKFRAEATKKANDLMRQSLTDNLIAKEFIAKWDGKLPTTYAGENILKMFNLK